jgi:hypothetical protein
MTKSIQEILEEQREQSKLFNMTNSQISAVIHNTGKVFTEETRAKLSASAKIRDKREAPTAETRAKIRAARKNQVFTEETRAKLSAASTGRHKGKTLSDEHRAKIRAARKNQVFTEETRAKLSASAKIRDKRESPTKETRTKQSESAKRNGISGKKGRPLKTPNGVFPTVKAAGDKAKLDGVVNAHKKIRKWLSNHPNDYYYISNEEYKQSIKNKDYVNDNDFVVKIQQQ